MNAVDYLADVLMRVQSQERTGTAAVGPKLVGGENEQGEEVEEAADTRP